MWFVILVVMVRFFTGAHLNGRTYNDSTWWLNASPQYRKSRKAYTWWRRKCRMKRLAWRNCVFWPVIFTIWALLFFTMWALIVGGIIAIPLAWYGGRRLRLALWLPVVANNSDGSVTQEWTLKPKARRRLQKLRRTPDGVRKRPGLARKSELKPGIYMTDIPADYEWAVRAELAEELDGQPSPELKLLMAPEELCARELPLSSP